MLREARLGRLDRNIEEKVMQLLRNRYSYVGGCRGSVGLLFAVAVFMTSVLLSQVTLADGNSAQDQLFRQLRETIHANYMVQIKESRTATERPEILTKSLPELSEALDQELNLLGRMLAVDSGTFSQRLFWPGNPSLQKDWDQVRLALGKDWHVAVQVVNYLPGSGRRHKVVSVLAFRIGREEELTPSFDGRKGKIRALWIDGSRNQTETAHSFALKRERTYDVFGDVIILHTQAVVDLAKNIVEMLSAAQVKGGSESENIELLKRGWLNVAEKSIQEGLLEKAFSGKTAEEVETLIQAVAVNGAMAILMVDADPKLKDAIDFMSFKDVDYNATYLCAAMLHCMKFEDTADYAFYQIFTSGASGLNQACSKPVRLRYENFMGRIASRALESPAEYGGLDVFPVNGKLHPYLLYAQTKRLSPAQLSELAHASYLEFVAECATSAQLKAMRYVRDTPKSRTLRFVELMEETGRAAGSPKPIINAGVAFQGLGEFDKAREAFRLVPSITDAPSLLTLAYHNLGALELDQKNNEAAIGYFMKELGLDPGNPELIKNVGIVCLKSGRKAEAAEMFKQYIAVYEATESKGQDHREMARKLINAIERELEDAKRDESKKPE